MTKFVLYRDGDRYKGFEFSGHCSKDDYDVPGQIICSAVSSVGIMAANTITDIICRESEVIDRDGFLKVTVAKPNENTDFVIGGLRLHIKALAQEYPDRIEIIESLLKD